MKTIIEALLPTDQLQRVYQTNAEFRAAIWTLAQLLPAWVDGLATKACVDNESTRELARKMARGEL